MYSRSFRGGLFTFDPLLIECFNPIGSVASCHIANDGKVLLLKRNKLTTAGNTWCMPGGKLEQNEEPLEAVIRETKEETGITLPPDQIHFVKTIYVRLLTPTKQDFLLHLFKATLPGYQLCDHKLVLNQEHTDYTWVDLEEAKQLNLIPGGKEIFESNLF